MAVHNAAVALYARAWVEIAKPDKGRCTASVALYARAWIEIRHASTLRV